MQIKSEEIYNNIYIVYIKYAINTYSHKREITQV